MHSLQLMACGVNGMNGATAVSPVVTGPGTGPELAIHLYMVALTVWEVQQKMVHATLTIVPVSKNYIAVVTCTITNIIDTQLMVCGQDGVTGQSALSLVEGVFRSDTEHVRPQDTMADGAKVMTLM